MKFYHILEILAICWLMYMNLKTLKSICRDDFNSDKKLTR